MKRLRSSDSFEAEERGKFEECEEDLAGINEAEPALGEKKRRLSAEQVKALEKNFEVENKLEPERKERLAQDLGLQPRQVAVWFQNRRARWKTKQMERDYAALSARHDALKLDCNALHRVKEALLAEIRELKGKIAERSEMKAVEEEGMPALIYTKDGASDSDTSAVLNDEAGPYAVAVVLNDQQRHCLMEFKSQNTSSMRLGNEEENNCCYLEEEFMGEELCSSFFSEEPAASLPWYCSQGWE
ncbi:homeobox-leucine zipper protein HOX13-like [Zingiber officinale]|uniref:Homeobox-leucine zipper protein n=1 Tax=Zingiber officinale TaxID=94328 RepID=A0A8J5MAV4_ZINOF|nr:homeobox-leucine zipper protein HOX13-like [Zingiber officinale]KAG6538755.1 hypothetical protein ZIOFF_003883 [Zingiber officinale]